MPRLRYSYQIFPRGAVSTTGAASYTFQTSQFGNAPMVGGQVIRPVDAIVESSPWTIDLVDLSGTAVSGILASTAGRMHLLGRLARLRVSQDSTASTAYKNVSVSRVTDVSLSGGVASYHITHQDERWVERQTDIFTKSNTTMLIPSGIISAFHNVPASAPAQWRVAAVVGNLVCLQYAGAGIYGSRTAMTASAGQLIVDDVKPGAVGGNTGITVGNFNHLRWRRTTTSVDYEVAGFDNLLSTVPPRPANTVAWFFQGWPDFWNHVVHVWAVWTASQPAIGSMVTGYCYMPTHPPAPELPLHIGGYHGLHPFALAESIYQGTYSGSTGLSVRYSTAAMAALKADASYGALWLRITGPVSMAQFLEDHIYGPYQVVPVLNTSGKLAPIGLRLPHSTGISLATLLTIGTSNVLDAHPTWEHPGNEVTNVLKLSIPQYVVPGIPQLTAASLDLHARTAAPDSIETSTHTLERTHDTVLTLGRRAREYSLAGTVSRSANGLRNTTEARVSSPGELADQIAASVFPRFGDGPIYTAVRCMDSVDRTTRGRVMPGMFVKVAVATQPNPATLARGSTRIMQVMERHDRPDGPDLRLLDVGPNLAVLAAPTLALAQSTQNTRHVVIGTVGSIPAGAQWQLQFAYTSTGTTAAPVTGSTKWFPVKATSRGSASTVFTRGQMPSKTKIWGRVRAFQPNRVGSAWSANASVVTASITAPSGLATTAITAGTATLKWTYGSSQYATEIMVDASTSATLGDGNRVAIVGDGTTRFEIAGLNSNDSHKWGVQHRDDFGGKSAQATGIFTTSTAYSACPAPMGLVIVRGR